MDEKFFSLPPEKQQRIINSGLEVFAKNSYRRASTDEIAVKAGISKGLLFYYFHSKKEFYTYLYKYSEGLLRDAVKSNLEKATTDFFEIMECGAVQKTKILKENPYIMDFSMRAFYSKNEEISQEIGAEFEKAVSNIIPNYFENVDLTKFKPGIKPEKILNMLIWLTDGYLHEHEKLGRSIQWDEMMKEFRSWSEILKIVAYKEEYISGNYSC